MLRTALQQSTAVVSSTPLLVALLVLAVSTVPVAVPVAADDPATNETPPVEIDNAPLSVEPPETAGIEVSAPEGEPLTFEIESVGDDRFAVEATVDEHDGDATMVLDTGNVTADDPSVYLSASGGELRNVTVHANEIEDLDRELLPGGMYDLQVTTPDALYHSTLEVMPAVRFTEKPVLNDSDLEADPEQTFAGHTDLDPGAELLVRATSRSEESFLISNETVVEDDGSFEATLDMSIAPSEAHYEVIAHHDGIAKGMTIGTVREDAQDEGAESRGLTLVYEGEQLELEAAPDQRVTGEADLDAGEPVTVRLQSNDETAFILSEETEVDDHGAFEATFDLDEVPPGTEFTGEARSSGADPAVSGSAPGVVVETDDVADSGDEERDETDDGAPETQIDDGDPGADSDDRDLLLGFGTLAGGAALAVVAIALLSGLRVRGS